jgi:ferric-dicitrate binding protein FerR (iron transport regulator)
MDMNNIDMDTLIVRILQGTSDKEEKAQFLSWLNDDKENETLFFQMKELFDARKRINLYDVQEVETSNSKKRDIPAKSVRPLFSRTWMRYAAIIFALLGGSFVVNLWTERGSASNSVVYVKQIVVHNARGVYEVTLPDGSKAWLHGATTITYPEKFTDSIRLVDLQGEAYFAVQSNDAYPFVVHTHTAKVRATGTEFNVTAYPKDLTTITTLVKGAVNVKHHNHNESVRLKPGQQAVTRVHDTRIDISEVSDAIEAAAEEIAVAKNDAIPVLVHEINTELFTDWKDGVYRFKDEAFHNIALRLEKMYGVNIHFEHEEIKSAAFSGMFTTDYSLKEIFEIISICKPISYTVDNKVVLIKNKH